MVRLGAPQAAPPPRPYRRRTRKHQLTLRLSLSPPSSSPLVAAAALSRPTKTQLTFADNSTVPREQRMRSPGVNFISALPCSVDHEPSVCASSQPIGPPAHAKEVRSGSKTRHGCAELPTAMVTSICYLLARYVSLPALLHIPPAVRMSVSPRIHFGWPDASCDGPLASIKWQWSGCEWCRAVDSACTWPPAWNLDFSLVTGRDETPTFDEPPARRPGRAICGRHGDGEQDIQPLYSVDPLSVHHNR